MKRLGLTYLALALAACGAQSGDAGGGDASPADHDTGPSLGDGGPGGEGGAPGGGAGGQGGTSGAEAGAGGAGGQTPDLGFPAPACNDGRDNDDDGQVDLADPGCTGPEDDDESDATPPAQCGDGVDNDGDHWTDVSDPDCTSESDPTEQGENEATVCHNELDDDADGAIDFPNDPGCRAAGDNSEEDPAEPATCNNGQDDDADGRTDYPEDPGCQGRGDMNEADPAAPPACANGADDDDDGLADFPADPGCGAAADEDESGACGPGHDALNLNAILAESDHYDGTLEGGPAGFTGSCGGDAGPEQTFEYRLGERVGALVFTTEHAETVKPTVLYVRTACLDPVDIACNRGSEANPGTTVRLERPDPGLYTIVVDTSSAALGPGAYRLSVETVPAPACDNGRDDDDDGRVDLDDPGCLGIGDVDEADGGPAPACADGQDNDGDGLVDFPNDPDCLAAGGDREGPECGGAVNLIPVEAPGGVFDLPLSVGDSTTSSFCGIGLGVENVLAVGVDEASRVTVVVESAGGDAMVSVRNACDDAQSELDCAAADFGESLTLVQSTEGAATLYFYIEANDQGFDGPAAQATATVIVESLITECGDEQDNDADGLVDALDPGCEGRRDDSEADPPADPACHDGEDNDGDGLIDFPADDGCLAAGDRDEAISCEVTDDLPIIPAGGGVVALDFTGDQDIFDASCAGRGPDQAVAFIVEHPSEVVVETINADFDTVLAVLPECDPAARELDCDDDGGDGTMSLLSFPRLEPGVYFATVEAFGGQPGTADLSVRVSPLLPPQCRDENDNDADGLTDADDPGCFGTLDDDEADPAVAPACADGVDNDADGAVDFPNDDGCLAAGSGSEADRCGDARQVIEVGQAGAAFRVDLADAVPLAETSCGPAGPEIPVVITLTEPSNVRVSAVETTGAQTSAGLALRDGCGQEAGGDRELACVQGFSGQSLVARRLEPGTYHLFLEADPDAPGARLDVVVAIDSLLRECNDGADNDADGLLDEADPGCAFGFDDDETDPAAAPVCADGVDNDEDGQVDFPEDPGCPFAGGAVEAPRCGADVEVLEMGPEGGEVNLDLSAAGDIAQAACTDGGVDGVIALTLASVSDVVVSAVGDAGETVSLFARTTCDGAGAQLACAGVFDGDLNLRRVGPGTLLLFVEMPAGAESTAADVTVSVIPVVAACNDGQDNDGDALSDAEDPGCTHALDADEDDPAEPAACADGEDNDADGQADFPLDPECPSAGAPSEAPRCPAGAEVVEVGPAGAVFTADMARASSLGSPACGNEGASVVVAVEIEELSALNVAVANPNFDSLAISLRDQCLKSQELACDTFFGEVDFNAGPLEAGTYFVVLRGDDFAPDAQYQVTVSVSSLIRECNDGLDNDEDARIDNADPGCEAGLDDTELDPDLLPECADGVDNDDDGATDYPDDSACAFAGMGSESASCEQVELTAILGDDGGQVNTDTNGLPDLYNGAGCGGDGEGGENVIAVILSQPADLVAEAIQTDYDTVIFARGSCDDVETTLGCDDDGGDVGLASRLELPNLQPGIYYIFVDGFGGDAGTALVDVQVTPR